MNFYFPKKIAIWLISIWLDYGETRAVLMAGVDNKEKAALCKYI